MLSRYAKAVAGGIYAALNIALTYYPAAPWLRITLATLSVLAVYYTPNTPKAP
jgi:hypothetical protein